MYGDDSDKWAVAKFKMYVSLLGSQKEKKEKSMTDNLPKCFTSVYL